MDGNNTYQDYRDTTLLTKGRKTYESQTHAHSLQSSWSLELVQTFSFLFKTCVGHLRSWAQEGFQDMTTVLVGALVTNLQHRLPGAHNTYEFGKVERKFKTLIQYRKNHNIYAFTNGVLPKKLTYKAQVVGRDPRSVARNALTF